MQQQDHIRKKRQTLHSHCRLDAFDRKLYGVSGTTRMLPVVDGALLLPSQLGPLSY
jgi:hypothetical protein